MIHAGGIKYPEESTNHSMKSPPLLSRRPGTSAGRDDLDLSLANLEHATLSAMAERVFCNSADNTTDSESEYQERHEHRHFIWRTQARPGLLPLVGEPINQTTVLANSSRELSLSEAPKNPWKTVRSGNFRRKNTFEAGGFTQPEKRRNGGDGCSGPTNYSTAKLNQIVGEGSLIELIDADGKIVQLRERPDSWQCCCYIDCQSPAMANCFKKVRKGSVSTSGFDWRPFVGRTFCNSCYARMSKRQTLSHHPTRGTPFMEKKRKIAVDEGAAVPRKMLQKKGCLASVSTSRKPTASISRCEVCFDPDSARDLTCASCGMVVHEQCYLGGERVSSISRAEWKCDPCSLQEPTAELSCILCPLQGGAFKRAACGGTFQWAHLACAINIPGLYMMDDENLDDIRGLEDIPDICRDRECAVCERTDFFCVTCDQPGCTDTCHPLCGVSNGWEMRIVMEEDQLNQQYMCPTHSSRGIKAAAAAASRVQAAEAKQDLKIKCRTCAKTWDGKQFMIRCDACAGFFHGSCVLVSEQRSKAMARFTCPKCPPTLAAPVESNKHRRLLKPRGEAMDSGLHAEVGGGASSSRPEASVPSRRSSKLKIRGRNFNEEPEQEESQPENVGQSSSANTVRGYEGGQSRLAPGCRILFYWNDSESYEGVAVCRANDLGKRSRGASGKRRTFGHDWWQVQWIMDGGVNGGKDIILLAQSNRERWELLSEASGAATTARALRKARAYRQDDTFGGHTLKKKMKGGGGSRRVPTALPSNDAQPFQPVPVFCAGNGGRSSEVVHGVLSVSSHDPRRLIVEHEGQELPLTDFETIAGNSGKRPKFNIRITATNEPVAEFLKTRWEASPTRE